MHLLYGNIAQKIASQINLTDEGSVHSTECKVDGVIIGVIIKLKIFLLSFINNMPKKSHFISFSKSSKVERMFIHI